MQKIKMNKAGDLPPGSPPPASDPLFGDAPPAGTPPGVTPPPGTPPAVNIPENWREALPEDLRALPFLDKHKDIPALVKAHANLEKMLGADKVPVPPKNATLEQLKDYFQKAGLPADAKEYKLDVDPKLGVDAKFLETFNGVAHGLNLLPLQAKGLVEWFAKANIEAENAQKSAYETARNEGINSLKKEWGDAFTNEVAKAKAALREFADDAGKEFFQNTNLGSNPHFVKMLAKMGATLAEDRIKGEGGSGHGQYTPSQAMQRIAELKANMKGPYWNPDHPDHFNVKKEVGDLYKVAHPGKPAPVSGQKDGIM